MSATQGAAARPRTRLAELATLASAGACLAHATAQAAARGEASLQLELWWVYSGAVCLGAGALSLLWPRSRAAVGVSSGLALLGVAMAGQHRGEPVSYALEAALATALALAALGRARRGPVGASARAGAPAPPRSERLAAAGFFVGALLVAAAFASALPPMHRHAVRHVTALLARYATRTGLSDRLDLSNLDGLQQSERVVLRVYGPDEGPLRGVVYDSYARGRWRVTRGGEDHPGARLPRRTAPDPAWAPDADARLGALTAALALAPPRLEPPRSSLTVRRAGAPSDRYFVPLARLSSARRAPVVATVDPYGLPRPREHTATGPLALPAEPGGPRASSDAPIAPPDARDLALAPWLRERLEPLVRAWTEGATSDAQRLARLERRLGAHARYDLQVPAPARGEDPVEAFLFRHRRGHCEYFASTLALLGRVAGVPTRVVAGYRGGEPSPYGGYRIVRDRNAHAWVEAFVPELGGWRTYDATPPAPERPDLRPSPSRFAALLDALAAWIAVQREGLRAPGPRDALWLAALLAAGFALNRALRAVRQRRARGASSALGDLRAPPAPEEFVALSSALEARGLARAPGETLSRFAARVVAAESALDAAARDEVAAALRAYEALRYGGEGALDAVRAALRSAARRCGAR